MWQATKKKLLERINTVRAKESETLERTIFLKVRSEMESKNDLSAYELMDSWELLESSWRDNHGRQLTMNVELVLTS
jgi:hypothetical protein